MRSSVNIAIGSMALSDALSGIIVTANAIGRNMKFNYSLPRFFCQHITYMKDVTATIPDLTFVVICYETTRPCLPPQLNKRALTSPFSAYVKAIFVWLFICFIYWWEIRDYSDLKCRQWIEMREEWCQLNWNYDLYELITSIVVLYIANTLTLVMWLSSMVTLCFRKRNVEAEGAETRFYTRQQWRVLQVVIAHLLITILTWFPEQYLFLNESDYNKATFDVKVRVTGDVSLQPNHAYICSGNRGLKIGIWCITL
jgi:hypothetical protein